MIATTLAAALALLAPEPGMMMAGQATPYAASSAASGPVLSSQDAALFRQGLTSARARDVIGTRSIMARISDPTARKLVEWALLDTSAPQLSYAELSQAQSQFAAWPRGDSRRQAGEKALDMAGAAPDTALAFFGDTKPTTIQGAVALASALEQRGRRDEAQALIRDWWRTQSFDDGQQNRILTRWGGWLSQADHDARLGMLLSGPHGPATRAMLSLVSSERRVTANAAMSLRSAYSPDAVVAGLSSQQARDPAVIQERVRILRAANRQSEGYPLLAALPPAPLHTEGQNTLWSERRNYFLDALAARNWQGAYDAMNGHGFPSGERKVDGEFFAGWVALTKLNNPQVAARHFETLRNSSTTPITQGRALYWLGRSAEAQGDQAGARRWYEAGAQHIQTFYGQLSAEKLGHTTLTLPGEPAPTATDVARFEGNEVVRATRILGETGEKTLMRVFAYHLDDEQISQPADFAQLMDLVKGYGDQFGSMMVGRGANQRGVVMPERMFPIRHPPEVTGAAPLEFTLAITRQESSFDPLVESHAGARGMMQFLPATASGVARRLGISHTAERLWDPDHNMALGSYHLAELTNNFGGSQLLATIGYNAGPARPPQWVARCGEPRGGQVDPIDFIECAPFTETRNYMMRVMENMQVYRARLNGGTGPLTLSQDLAKGTPPGPRAYSGGR
ncbi:lytic transglycosylase domain-containing protein [Brevundimonas sp.]|uniref:lytic transglycosylase domain-containing protein n=1 Tax=Brevundimonas sp. TaxID=1871086 RepID=UPI0025C190C3|nr:lytic transglycosylase domain-containing protein [Brevundimonas sp.]